MLSLALAVLTAAAQSAQPSAAADFTDDITVLFDVVTCQPGDPPKPIDAAAVKAYCDKQKPRFERFTKHWGSKATVFLEGLQPANVPTEVVYPFGGGDLMMALATYPKAQTITTLSLELAGDPRRLRSASDAKALGETLQALLDTSATTLISNDSKSVNLSRIQRGQLPGQLAMHLMGLSLFGLRPVSARFFRIEPDGQLHYFTTAEIAALDGQNASQLKSNWSAPDFSPAFANVEVTFVPANQPTATPRVFRHIAANLSNDGLKAQPGVLEHLKGKGAVAAMTKAASYLLWRDEQFSLIRDYLVGHAQFMVSDSTGVLPRFWRKAGCTVTTYGSFETTFLGTWSVYRDELKREFDNQPKRELPMRFGYPDGSAQKRSHLVVASCANRRASPAVAP